MRTRWGKTTDEKLLVFESTALSEASDETAVEALT